jgi:hypothetical protein
MQRFNVSRVGRRVRGRLALPWQRVVGTRLGVLAFGASVMAGIAVGAFLGVGPIRALATGVGGRARNVAGRATTNGQAFVTLSSEAEPVPADTARDRDRDLAGRSM